MKRLPRGSVRDYGEDTAMLGLSRVPKPSWLFLVIQSAGTRCWSCPCNDVGSPVRFLLPSGTLRLWHYCNAQASSAGAKNRRRFPLAPRPRPYLNHLMALYTQPIHKHTVDYSMTSTDRDWNVDEIWEDVGINPLLPHITHLWLSFANFISLFRSRVRC